MSDASFFLHPKARWQRIYEVLRASFVEHLPAKLVAERFGYTPGYVRLLRYQFRHGQIDLTEPPPEGKSQRRRVDRAVREKIRKCREERLSAGDIAQVLSEDGLDISVRTVERVLAEEGFPKLPRRTRLQIGLTVRGARVPETSEALEVRALPPGTHESPGAGVFLFAPFLSALQIQEVVRAARLPGTKAIPAVSYLLSFLALKLLGTERFAHVGDHAFDPGLGLFAGLNVLPKCTAMSTYSYGLDEVHIQRLQKAFVEQATARRLYAGKVVNLDFHTVPHYGEESVLEKHWAGARGKAVKGALTLFAQDCDSRLLLYSEADIRRSEADDQVLEFVSFWRKVRRGVMPTLIFDSQLTSYRQLSELNRAGVKFITLRRRGKKLLESAEAIQDWRRIHIPHPKRKFPNPLVHECYVHLRNYDGEVREVIMKGNGHEKPSFLITNDELRPVEAIVGDYARRWRVENGIAEMVKFFHLNALSSPILVKVHFDVVMTVIADTLYSMLAQYLRGFEDCNAPKLYRHFVRGKGTVHVRDGTITVTYPRRAHNPIVRAVPWSRLPTRLPWLGNAKLVLRFQ